MSNATCSRLDFTDTGTCVCISLYYTFVDRDPMPFQWMLFVHKKNYSKQKGILTAYYMGTFSFGSLLDQKEDNNKK